MKRKNLIVVLLVLVMVLAVSTVTMAGFFDWLTGGEKAEESKVIKVVGSFSNEDKVFEQFTKDTGIKVESLDMSSGEVLSRAKAENGKPMADVWFGGGVDSFIAAKKAGLLEQYKSPEAQTISAMYKDEDGYWTGLYLVITGFIVNNEVLAEKDLDIPTEWADLVDPQYKDEVLMSNPAISGTNYAILNSLLQDKGKEEGWEYFDSLSNNTPYFAKRGSEPYKKTIFGEVGIGITYINGDIMKLENEYPVTVVYPEDGIPWVPGSMAIFKNADNLEGAKSFVDWALSKKGQQFMSELNSTIMVRNDVKVPQVLEEAPLDKLLNVSFDAFGKERDSIIKIWTERVDK